MLAATYATRAGMSIDDVADTWASYLTMAESLRIAAGLFRNEMPTSCCARAAQPSTPPVPMSDRGP